MVGAFDLGALSHRDELTLTLSGTLVGGTFFEASDCIVIAGQAKQTGLQQMPAAPPPRPSGTSRSWRAKRFWLQS